MAEDVEIVVLCTSLKFASLRGASVMASVKKESENIKHD